MNIDFTTSKYVKLLAEMKNSGYSFYTIRDWIREEPSSGVIIRHDVDRRAKNSLKIARHERDAGIAATYYFRVTKGSFRKEIIKEIAELGHEIGYHYEDLTTCGGDIEKSIDSFKTNLERLREEAEIRTIAMHGKPISRYNNLDMWKKHNYTDYGIEGEAYLTIDYKDIHYYSDTGRNWRSSGRANYKDYAGGIADRGIKSTDDLTDFIKSEKPKKLVIMTHPERWNDSFRGYMYYLLRDNFTNAVKSILSILLKRKEGTAEIHQMRIRDKNKTIHR